MLFRSKSDAARTVPGTTAADHYGVHVDYEVRDRVNSCGDRRVVGPRLSLLDQAAWDAYSKRVDCACDALDECATTSDIEEILMREAHTAVHDRMKEVADQRMKRREEERRRAREARQRKQDANDALMFVGWQDGWDDEDLDLYEIDAATACDMHDDDDHETTTAHPTSHAEEYDDNASDTSDSDDDDAERGGAMSNKGGTPRYRDRRSAARTTMAHRSVVVCDGADARD